MNQLLIIKKITSLKQVDIFIEEALKLHFLEYLIFV
jgi:hypothetical protein